LESFDSNGYRLAYSVFGAGPLLVLIHGFASNSRVNWIETGWVGPLLAAGYRVACIDNRGHGASDKPHDPAAYALAKMGADALNLIAHLGERRAAVVGYSMGAKIAAHAALAAPQAIAAAVFGGIGIHAVRDMADTDDTDEIEAALRAPDPGAIASPVGRTYRDFAERTGSDLMALAACVRPSRQSLPADALSGLSTPVLVAVGAKDAGAGAPGALAALMPNAEAIVIEGRDHMRTSGDRQFQAAVGEFLSRHFPGKSR